MKKENDFINRLKNNDGEKEKVEAVFTILNGFKLATEICDNNDSYIAYLALQMASNALLKELGVKRYLELVGEAIEIFNERFEK